MRGFRFVIVAVLGVLALIAPAFAQEAAVAVEPAVDPIVALLTSLLGAGFVAQWGTVTVAGVALLRAGAATLSKHVTDEQLGRAASVVNWLGGNTKHAVNDTSPAQGSKVPAAAATSLVLGVLALGLVFVACKTQTGHTLAVLACKSQCPIAYAVAIDVCDGDADGKVTPPDEPNTLYGVCVSEAELIRVGCPVLCDQIPFTPPEET